MSAADSKKIVLEFIKALSIGISLITQARQSAGSGSHYNLWRVQTHIRGHQIQLEFSFGFAIYKLSPTIDPKALRVSRAAPVSKRASRISGRQRREICA